MPAHVLSTVLALAFATSSVLSQDTATYTYTSGTPLASKHFQYPDLPYKADPDDGVRGTQFGYNECNSTTENQQSLCQTALIDHIDDFCLWAPPIGPDTIGDTEQEEVAWCTKNGHGTRIIPAGAITGVQLLTTPDYIQIVGFIDQEQINILSNDSGGELDPHGADFRGNPLGGLVYSNAFPSNNGNNNSYQQVIEWTNFMGGNQFCFKACDPAGANAANYCQHIFDRIGCAYNAPNNAQNGTFEVCESPSADFPGVYTNSAGQVVTYTQPAESLGPISTMPYTPKVPQSSNCVTYQSSDLYHPTLSGATATPTATSGRSTGTVTPTVLPGSSSSAYKSASPSQTASTTSGALTTSVSVLSTLFGVAFAITFFG